MNRTIILSILCQICFGCFAQETWTLKRCIEYATANNIDIKQRELEKVNKGVEVHTAKMSRLPDLSLNAGESFGFGRSTGRDGTMRDNTSSQTYANLSTSIPLFTGFRLPNQLEAKKFDLATATENLKKAKEDLSLNITGLFLQALFYKEIQKISQQQVELSQQQVEQSEKLVNAGKSPISELYESKAQLAKDELSLTESRNNVTLALLDLIQTLNLSPDQSFDISEPDFSQLLPEQETLLINPLDIYAYSVRNRPGIKAAGYALESAKRNLKVAQSYYYPNINLNAGYGNNYFYNYNLPADQKNASFGDQLRNNGSESLSLALSFPIFNRFATRNSVKQAKLNIINMQLDLEKAKQNLYKEIQQAFVNAVAAKDKYRSAQKSVEASSLSYQSEQTKYDNGRSSAFELSNARTRLEKSKSEETQAKFDYIFRSKILDFYQGKSLYINE